MKKQIIIANQSESTVIGEFIPRNNTSDKYQSEADLEKEFIEKLGRVKSKCVKKIAIGITPVAFLNLFFPNSNQPKEKWIKKCCLEQQH